MVASYEASPTAMQHVDRYLAAAEQLAANRPGDPDAQSALGVAYSQAGKVAAAAERIDAAMQYFRRNGEIQSAIVAAAPYNITARRNLMLAWSTLSDTALGPLGQSSYTGPAGPAVDIDPRLRADALDASTKALEQARSDPGTGSRERHRELRSRGGAWPAGAHLPAQGTIGPLPRSRRASRGCASSRPAIRHGRRSS